MREVGIDITHEIVVKDGYLYPITDLKRIVENLKTYKNIEEIKMVTIGTKVYLKLYGIRTMCGYKVEDAGFYDVLNDEYYHPIRLEKMEIIEIKKIKGYAKKKVRINKKCLTNKFFACILNEY